MSFPPGPLVGKQRINWEGDFINTEEQTDPLRKKKGDFSVWLLCLSGLLPPQKPLRVLSVLPLAPMPAAQPRYQPAETPRGTWVRLPQRRPEPRQRTEFCQRWEKPPLGRDIPLPRHPGAAGTPPPPNPPPGQRARRGFPLLEEENSPSYKAASSWTRQGLRPSTQLRGAGGG